MKLINEIPEHLKLTLYINYIPRRVISPPIPFNEIIVRNRIHFTIQKLF